MRTILMGVLLAAVSTSLAQGPALRIEQVMTAQELQQTGVSTLSPAQREALNRWLVSYTLRIFETTQQRPAVSRSDCAVAIETTIAGEFHGWDGETIFKLGNGQIWQQAEYAYTYSYSYRPNVTIYQTRGGCRMKVEDEDETILVKRLK